MIKSNMDYLQNEYFTVPYIHIEIVIGIRCDIVILSENYPSMKVIID